MRFALEEVVQNRAALVRFGKGSKQQEAAKIMAALFQHGSSRAGDPQLHTHSVIFNIGWRENGNTNALDNRPLYTWASVAGALYDSALSYYLQNDLGVEMHLGQETYAVSRIKGVDEKLCQAWSSRRREILARGKEAGYVQSGNHAGLSRLTVQSRAHKESTLLQHERHHVWRNDTREMGFDPDQAIAGSREPLMEETRQTQKEDAIRRLIDIAHDLTRTEAVFTEQQFIRQVLHRARNVLDPKDWSDLSHALMSDLKLVECAYQDGRLRRGFTTKEVIRQELLLVRVSRLLGQESAHGIAHSRVTKQLEEVACKGGRLNEEQVRAVHHATVKKSLAIIEGAAGAGKTFVMDSVVQLYQAQGYEVIGTAISWQRSNDIGSDLNIFSCALSPLLSRITNDKIPVGPKTLFIVDEAGMLATRQLKQLLMTGQRAGAKVICNGDNAQHHAIEAGPGMQLAARAVGFVKLNVGQRQKADVEDVLVWRDGLSRQDARYQVGALTEGQRVELVSQNSQAIEEAVRDGSAFLWQRQAVNLLRCDQPEIAQAFKEFDVRNKLHLLPSREAALERVAHDYLAWATDRGGQTALVLAQSNADVHDLSLMIREQMKGAHLTGEEVNVPVYNGPKAKPRDLPLMVGEQVRFGRRNNELGVVNGTLGTITQIREVWGNPHFNADVGGRNILFAPADLMDRDGFVHLKHGYASTIASAQGDTVDRSFVYLNQMVSKEPLYSALSRHRHDCQIYADRSAFDAAIRENRTEVQQELPITRCDILERMAFDLGREGQKIAAIDGLSPEQLGAHQESLDQERGGVSFRLFSEAKEIDQLVEQTLAGFFQEPETSQIDQQRDRLAMENEPQEPQEIPEPQFDLFSPELGADKPEGQETAAQDYVGPGKEPQAHEDDVHNDLNPVEKEGRFANFRRAEGRFNQLDISVTNNSGPSRCDLQDYLTKWQRVHVLEPGQTQLETDRTQLAKARDRLGPEVCHRIDWSLQQLSVEEQGQDVSQLRQDVEKIIPQAPSLSQARALQRQQEKDQDYDLSW